MTNQLEALDRLIEAVEAGEQNKNDGTLYKLFGDNWVHAWDVIDRDSLDAAKVLHEALLPGWEWRLGPSNANVYPYNGSPEKSWNGMANNAARAWLIAVLKAYRNVAK